MQPECLKSVSLRFNSWAQLRKPNTNISRLSLPVRRVWAACLHRLCYIINAVCLLIQACSLCQPWLCVLYSVSSWFFFKLAYLIRFLSFFCLSFLLSLILFFMPVCLFLLLSFNRLPHYFPHCPFCLSLLLSHSIFSDNAGRLYTVWLLVNVPFAFIFQSWFSYAYNDGCESATCNGRTAFHHIIIAWHDKSRQPRGGALLAHLMLIVPSIYNIEIQVQVQYSRATSKSVTVWPLTRDATPLFCFHIPMDTYSLPFY